MVKKKSIGKESSKKTSKKVKLKKKHIVKRTPKKNLATKNISTKKDLRIKVIPPQKKLRKNQEIAIDFASLVHKKFDKLVKATVLFGSEAKKTSSSKSDIDIIVIIDDVSVNWDLELIAWYREELGKIISLNRYSRDLHINTIKLSTWWNDLMHGDPVVINILRYGQPLIDSGGFFNPLKSLLIQGKIHATPEAVYVALQRAPAHLARSKAAEASAIEGVYWAMADSAQAALMTLGKLPPSPEHLPAMLMRHFVENKMLKKEYVSWFKEVFTLHKAINHGEISDVKGVEIDSWQEKAEKFMLAMTRIIESVLKNSNN